MRLTLRTLLAYLDDILDPADARELGKKIEESEFASTLVHRIRSVTRKLRLGAPKLTGKGMGLDANTVAEYLDNTLSQDRVPDFEKVCLESDVQLAEVAACHQILTLVLGEPAEVDANLRDRMRSLQRDLEQASELRRAAATAGPDEPEPAAAREPQRASEWDSASELPVMAGAATRPPKTPRGVRMLPIVGTLVVTFLLALVALIAIGPLDRRHPILGRFFAEKPADAPAAGDATPIDGSGKRLATNADQAATKRAAVDDPAEPSGEEPTKSEPEAPSADPDEPPAQPAAPDDTPDDAQAGKAQPAEPEPAGAGPVTAMNDPALMRSNLPPDEEEEAAKEPAAPPPLAIYASDQHVLARFDAEKKTWVRLVANDELAPDVRLAALPTYRPQILLSNGVQVMIVGPAELHLTALDAEGVPGIVLQYGRLVVLPANEPNKGLDIQFGPRHARVMFEDQDATLVLDGWRYHPRGVDPQKRTANWVIDAFTPAGRFSWQDRGTADPLVLEQGQLATLVDSLAPALQPLKQEPDWLDVNREPKINQLGSRQLEPLLLPDQPLAEALREQVDNRLVEVRMLAIRALSQFDEFDPCIAGLNSGELRYFWKDIAESLRAAAARSQEAAQQVHAAFTRLRGDQAALLEQLLWGFPPEQLSTGAAQQLVESLSHASMDVRVLAYLNLNAITGKTNNFQPEKEPRNQRRSIMNWEQDLQQNKITYRTPPEAPPGVEAPAATPLEGGPVPEGASQGP